MPDTVLDLPFRVHDPDATSHWIVTCDHATNRVPPSVRGGDLGLSPEDMSRHIAYDIGAAGVASELARLLGATAIMTDYSRLVIDPNRAEDDPTLLMRLYDGTIVPGNRSADAAEREARLEAFHRPYHAALAALLAVRSRPAICSIHSFTPQLRGRPPRPWQIGVLFSDDRRLADPLIARLRRESDLEIGVNEPYSGHLPGDALDRHAIGPGRLHVLIELRNDLIADPVEQRLWAGRLAPHLQAALEEVTHAHG